MKNNWKIRSKVPEHAGRPLAAAAQAPPTVARTCAAGSLIGCCGRTETSFISERIHAHKDKKFKPPKEEIHQSGPSAGPSQESESGRTASGAEMRATETDRKSLLAPVRLRTKWQKTRFIITTCLENKHSEAET